MEQVSYHKSSFSLIELIIVVVLIVMLSGWTIAHFNTLTAEEELSKEAKRFTDILDLARKKTLSGDSSMCLSVPQPKSSGFNVSITDENSYQLVPNCEAGTPDTITYDMSGHVAFTSYPQLIEYRPYMQVEEKKIILKETNINKCLEVEIESAGTTELLNCDTCDSCP